MAARAMSGASRAWSSRFLRSSTRLRLPRLSSAKATLSRLSMGRWRRISSPPGRSILITSAPASASIKVASGPGSRVVKSSTSRPDSGCGMATVRRALGNYWIVSNPVEDYLQEIKPRGMHDRTTDEIVPCGHSGGVHGCFKRDCRCPVNVDELGQLHNRPGRLREAGVERHAQERLQDPLRGHQQSLDLRR